MTAVQFNDDPSQVISAGIDNDLKIWDTRKNSVLTEMSGHTDTVTGMKLSPDGAHVLTNAMDNTVRMWVSWGKPVVSRTFMVFSFQDVRPFCTGERCVKMFSGHSHNFEKNLLHCAWSPDGELVAAGSSDR